MIVKLALLQIAAQDTLDRTRDKGISFCRRAKEMGADAALFPEMFSNGYNIYDRPVNDWKEEAVSVHSDFVTAFGCLAKNLTWPLV